MISIKPYVLLIALQLISYSLGLIKPKLTLDEFFDNVDFHLVSFSPTGRHILIETRAPSWNASTFMNSLWLYQMATHKINLITSELASFSKPQWSPSGNQIALLLNKTPRSVDHETYENYIHIYSIETNQLVPVTVGRYMPVSLVWGSSDSTLFFTTVSFTQVSQDSANEWRDVIQFQAADTSGTSAIYRVRLGTSTNITLVRYCPFIIGELLLAPALHKFLLTSVSRVIEDVEKIEIYSLDPRNTSILSRLTNNNGIEQDLKLSPDNRHVFFRMFSLGVNRDQFSDTFYRLCSIDLQIGSNECFAKHFPGSITDYAFKRNGGVYIVGQLGTHIQVYEQLSPEHDLIYRQGWNGTYALVSTSKLTDHIAFVHSSFEKPKEVYLAESIDQLQSAQAITNVNKVFVERDLPKGKLYQWKNRNDNQTIEGILRYPPGQVERKQLPLLVLIHGGLYSASVNGFHIDWENWGLLAATYGWLVFEPNYRGSTGYGSQFVHDVRYKFLSCPAQDILSGVDQLIEDGIVDPNKLAVGGYSYGGYLTNWIITQTNRFNAALSGAGAVEHGSEWGTIDFPIFEYYLLGGAPWDVPEIYQSEAPIYRFGKVQTPTHIITGQNDMRVTPSQSKILERALRHLGVPVKLLIFPNEDHSISNDPWHGKIKVREELKWLQKYGFHSLSKEIK